MPTSLAKLHGCLPVAGVALLPNGDATIDHVAIAFGSVIKQGIGGSAKDILLGDSAVNQLDGGAGRLALDPPRTDLSKNGPA